MPPVLPSAAVVASPAVHVNAAVRRNPDDVSSVTVFAAESAPACVARVDIVLVDGTELTSDDAVSSAPFETLGRFDLDAGETVVQLHEASNGDDGAASYVFETSAARLSPVFGDMPRGLYVRTFECDVARGIEKLVLDERGGVLRGLREVQSKVRRRV